GTAKRIRQGDRRSQNLTFGAPSRGDPDSIVKQRKKGTASRARDAWRPSWCRKARSRNKEGAGKAGCSPHPWPACNKKSRRQSPQAQPNPPAFPARWCYGYFVLSPVTIAWLPPSSAKRFRGLSACFGAPGPHDFAVRVSIVRPRDMHALDATRVHRIPHPRFVTIGRNAPLHRGGTVRMMLVIWGK